MRETQFLTVAHGIHDDIVPVSYTHLDVYKRQVYVYLLMLGLDRKSVV